MRLGTVCLQIRLRVPGLELINVEKIKMLALNDLMYIIYISSIRVLHQLIKPSEVTSQPTSSLPKMDSILL